ncbi:MAG: FecR domain-containing protein [Candidatus Riflebacteria bacterium]|nr:FecR domain-containing protein [Candidatus Riflebacteria bacterium]
MNPSHRFFRNSATGWRNVALSAVLGLAFLTVVGCGGGGSSPSAIATLGQVQGKVEARSRGGDPFAPAAGEVSLQAGGAVRTGEDGHGQVKYLDGTEVALSPETYYEVKEQTTLGRQESGSGRYRVSPQKTTVEVETPHGVTAVLGTAFRLDVTATQTVVSLQEGKVRFTSPSRESVELTPGQQLTVTAGQPLGQPAELDPITLETLFNPGARLPGINQR